MFLRITIQLQSHDSNPGSLTTESTCSTTEVSAVLAVNLRLLLPFELRSMIPGLEKQVKSVKSAPHRRQTCRVFQSESKDVSYHVPLSWSLVL